MRKCEEECTMYKLSLIKEIKMVFTAPEFSSLCRSGIINPKVFYESDLDVGVLLNTFFINTWENDTWPELEWLTEKQ